jgi:hypothetical protein
MEIGVIREYLKFEKYIMPYTLQVPFLSGIGGTLYGKVFFIYYAQGNSGLANK